MMVDNTLSAETGERSLTHRTDWEDFENPSTAVAVAVAEATDTEPNELDVLNDYIDGDALDAVLTGSPAGVDVTFRYAGVTVSVSSGGRILIEDD